MKRVLKDVDLDRSSKRVSGSLVRAMLNSQTPNTLLRVQPSGMPVEVATNADTSVVDKFRNTA